MKLIAHIISAEDMGDHMKVEFQGNFVQEAMWSPMRKHTIIFPMTETAKRSLSIGRYLKITVEPVRKSK